jgi:hypothetical protein
VDKTKRFAYYEIEFDAATSHPKVIRYVIESGTRGAKGGKSTDIFRAEAVYTLTNIGGVRSLDIPKEAKKFLKR